MTAELTRTLLLIGLATCAAFVALLSFFPWVDFTPDPTGNSPGPASRPFSLNGTELSRIRGAVTIEQASDQMSEACSCKNEIGDGYLVAIVGAVTFAGACAALYFRAGARTLVLVAMTAALAAFAIGGYNAIAIWEGVGRSHDTAAFSNLDGSVRLELYALTALAAAAAVLGGAALATTTRTMPTDDDQDWDDGTPELEEVSGWA